jgi:hypothetical protein
MWRRWCSPVGGEEIVFLIADGVDEASFRLPLEKIDPGLKETRDSNLPGPFKNPGPIRPNYLSSMIF